MEKSTLTPPLSGLSASDGTDPQDISRASAITRAAGEWHTLIKPLLPIGERMVALMQDPSDPQLRKEIYRLIFMGIATGWVGRCVSDPEHPDFFPIFDAAFNWFASNPDAVYCMAPLAGDGIYRLSGFCGTVRFTDIQIGKGSFLRGDGMLGPIVGNFSYDDLTIECDGSFEVILSRERPPGHEGDWWQLDAAATNMLVRQFSYDWLHEVDGRFAIERLDRRPGKPRQSGDQIDLNIQLITTWAENMTTFAVERAKHYLAKGLLNNVEIFDLTKIGGATNQHYIQGVFEVEPDEAIIYESEIPTQALYWNVQLSDSFWTAIDAINRQSSLNGLTARLDKDGKFRAVISATDPGIPNWLDTAGYKRGVIDGRWTKSNSAPVPTLTRVKLADVRKYLPHDTPSVTIEERDAANRLRRKGAQLRRRW